ncbi:hypothetical protein [Streptomyces fulvoviolaceus]|uniref:hypothetical protein n=1 Tax=Streptomyces fulvoviolaceus TaxID=285535 RepID=UPI0021C0C859|nr:hypothetical protein [Streptomyces fulvoviolaceus]MCT9075475.1 hypothetical protein [Streptomyces fulvoviolaceus]
MTGSMLRPEKVFAESLTQVLAEPELSPSPDIRGRLTPDQLRPVAEAREVAFLGQVAEAHNAYQQAVLRSRAASRLRRLLIVVGVIALVMLLSSSAASGWNEVLKEALTKDRPVRVSSVVGEAFGLLLGLTVFIAAGTLVMWVASYVVSSKVRAGVPTAKAAQWLLTLGINYCLLVWFCAVGIAVEAERLTWQLVHDQPLGTSVQETGLSR